MIREIQMYVKSKTKELCMDYFIKKKNAAQTVICAALHPNRPSPIKHTWRIYRNYTKLQDCWNQAVSL